MTRPFVTLDVFTDTPFAGNPLAVVGDGEGLDTAQMQAIAKEFNLSETTFVFPPENAANTARVRIFTPSQELPFAGHPTIGTAIQIASERFGAGQHTIRLEEKVGLIECRVTIGDDGASRAVFPVPALAFEDGAPASVLAFATLLGLEPDEIGFGDHQPSVYNGGLPYTLVPVRDIEAIGRVIPDLSQWTDVVGTGFHNSIYLYTAETVHPDSHFHARMFWPTGGLREDPATGSAVSSFVGALNAYENLADGSHEFIIEQGFEMGRPSLITLSVDIFDGGLRVARIGGSAVPILRGELTL